ncbi:hypothetical protein COCNU_scaffold036336G000030 [Cocos nucifera]|nr:hypothetical protein [Cocos nucifera]
MFSKLFHGCREDSSKSSSDKLKQNRGAKLPLEVVFGADVGTVGSDIGSVVYFATLRFISCNDIKFDIIDNGSIFGPGCEEGVLLSTEEWVLRSEIDVHAKNRTYSLRWKLVRGMLAPLNEVLTENEAVPDGKIERAGCFGTLFMDIQEMSSFNV